MMLYLNISVADIMRAGSGGMRRLQILCLIIRSLLVQILSLLLEAIT